MPTPQIPERDLLAAIVQSSDDTIISKTLDGTILSWNAGAERMYGYTAEEAIGQSISILIPPEYPDDASLILERIKRGERVDHYETMRRHKDGHVLYVSLSVSPVYDADGNVIAAAKIARDITEQKRFQQRLMFLYQLMAELAQALTRAQISRIITDKVVVALGGDVGAVVSLSEDGKTLQQLSQVNLSDDLAALFQSYSFDFPTPMVDAARTGEPVWIENRVEYAAQYPHLATILGDKTPVQAGLGLPLRIDGRVRGAIGIAFNQPRTFNLQEQTFILTIAHQCALALERARLAEEAQIAAAREERQRLARELHDAVTQTLFSSTTIAATLPRLWKTKPERALSELEQVIVLNRAALAEMRTLLLELRPEAALKIPLSDLLRQLVEASRGSKRKDISLIITGDELPLPPDVHLAFYRIAQEAINNVLKHSQAKRFEVCLEHKPEQVMLRITDDGKGFDPQEFHAGLGLGLMRERAEAVGATLQVSSKIGQGTALTVIVPRLVERFDVPSPG